MNRGTLISAKFEQAFVDRKDMEYSYNDGDLYYFMDMESYDTEHAALVGHDLAGHVLLDELEAVPQHVLIDGGRALVSRALRTGAARQQQSVEPS